MIHHILHWGHKQKLDLLNEDMVFILRDLMEKWGPHGKNNASEPMVAKSMCKHMIIKKGHGAMQH